MLAPGLRLVRTTGLGEHARELRRVVGIIGVCGQPAEAHDGVVTLPELEFDLGQMALGLRIRGQSSPCRMKPVTGSVAVSPAEPQVTALKLELRDWKWADAAIA